MRAALLAAVLCLGCRSGAEPAAGPTAPPRDPGPSSSDATSASKVSPDEPPPPPAPMPMKPALDPALEAELAAIHKDPGQSVGFGEKAFIPYVPNVAHGLIRADDPAITQRLVAEIRGAADRVDRLALLHVLGKRQDATVDAALIGLLDDPQLRGLAAYLLGAINFKGQPTRARDAAATKVVLDALRPWLDDATPFEDPFHKKSLATGDLALGAFLRTAGVEHFTLSPNDRDLVGLALPSWNPATRADLARQAKAFR